MRLKNRLVTVSAAVLFALALLTGKTNAYAEKNLSLSTPVSNIDLKELPVTKEMLQSDDIITLDPNSPTEDDINYASTEIGSTKDYWRKFSSDYYYNQFTTGQKVLWDKLKEECLGYLVSDDNAYVDSSSKRTAIYDVSAYGVTKSQVEQVVFLFTYANPQFYFLANSAYTSPSYAGIIFYDEYVNGEARLEETRKFKTQIDAWVNEVNKATTGYYGDELDLKREEEIFYLICDEFTYTSGSKDQSAVSGVVYKNTVCAGYTKTMSILLNAFGIENIAVTSSYNGSGHAWNEVHIGSKWYLADATWGDQKTYIVNAALNTTNDGIDTYFSNSKNHNTANYKNLYNGLTIPACSTILDKAYDWKTATPTISGYGDSTYSVSINGRDSYDSIKFTAYTGPYSPSYKATNTYSGAVSITKSKNSFINATATRAGFDESRVATYGFFELVYDENGGTGDYYSTVTCEVGKPVKLNKATFTKSGMKQIGWNTKSDGTGYSFGLGATVTLLSDIPGDMVTLYAEWEKVEYSITYMLNGGTNNYNNPGGYGPSSGTITLADPTRDGYTFAGWYSDSYFTNRVTTIYPSETGSKTLYAKWNLVEYTITYVLNGGTNSINNPSSYTVETSTFTLSNPTKSGTTFKGWYSDSDFTTKVSSVSKGSTGNKTFYAKWESDESCKVTYELDGGTNSPYNPTEIKPGYIYSLYMPEKEGYTFDGWYKEASFTNSVTYLDYKDYKDNKEIKLYAKWKRDEYTITYILYGGLNSNYNPSSYNMYTRTFTLSNPTKQGALFLGWFLDSGFTTQVTSVTQGSTGSKTFYAKWETYEYSITYELNGGTNSEYNPSSYTEDDDTIELEDPKKLGYTFAGWYLESEFINEITEIETGSTGDITLYAKWELESFNITYELNGGKNSKKNPSTYTCESWFINLSAPTRDGYTFVSWYTDEDFMMGISTIMTGSTGDITLYAKWNPVTYFITYEVNGGFNSSSNPAFYTPETDTFELEEPTRDGYVFAGWYLDEYFEIEVTEVEKGSFGDKKFYAKWESGSFSVTYKLNGGTNSDGNPSSYKKTDDTISLESPSKKGYVFKGWYTDSKYTDSVTSIEKGSTGNKIFYAKWEASSYNIAYELNGGKNATSNPTSYTLSDSAVKLANAKRAGYSFEGWYLDKSFTKKVTSIKAGYSGDITLYAKWKVNTYSIKYYLDGGTNNKSNPSGYTVNTKTISLKTPTKEGYTFGGWYTSSSYKTKVTKITKGTTGSKKLYAKWVPNTYNIKFNGNGATSGSMKTISNVKYGKKVTLTNNSYKKKGYTFVGWNTRKDGKGTTYKNKASVKSLLSKNGKTITLYAIWKKK